jgi:hypothetical protein
MDGLKKFNKEKDQEQEECHILKLSQESLKTILKALTDLHYYLNIINHFL